MRKTKFVEPKTFLNLWRLTKFYTCYKIFTAINFKNVFCPTNFVFRTYKFEIYFSTSLNLVFRQFNFFCKLHFQIFNFVFQFILHSIEQRCFTYNQSFLYYIVYELLKNSYRFDIHTKKIRLRSKIDVKK